MSVQVLVATMHQKDHSLLEKMNIASDIIVGNQCDINSIEKFKYKDYNATYLNFNEKGVGLNRNNALMRATGDICIFADDDIVYFDNYSKIITQVFEKNKKADVIVFNLEDETDYGETKPRCSISKTERVRWYNFLRYGTARIAIKLSSIKECGIFFNQCFGGGTEHMHGEDNLFLTDCLRKKLKIYAVPVTLGRLTNERESTWNNGYGEKYLKDQGILYKAISRKWWKLLCVQDCIRRKSEYKCSFSKAYKLMRGK